MWWCGQIRCRWDAGHGGAPGCGGTVAKFGVGADSPRGSLCSSTVRTMQQEFAPIDKPTSPRVRPTDDKRPRRWRWCSHRDGSGVSSRRRRRRARGHSHMASPLARSIGTTMAWTMRSNTGFAPSRWCRRGSKQDDRGDEVPGCSPAEQGFDLAQQHDGRLNIQTTARDSAPAGHQRVQLCQLAMVAVR